MIVNGVNVGAGLSNRQALAGVLLHIGLTIEACKGCKGSGLRSEIAHTRVLPEDLCVQCDGYGQVIVRNKLPKEAT